MVHPNPLSHAGGVSDNDSPRPHPHEAVAKAAGCRVCLFVHPLHFNRAADSMLGPGNQGINELKGQSCPPQICCPTVEKDDFPSHCFVTLVMVAGRRSNRSGPLPGSVVDRLARPTDCLICGLNTPDGPEGLVAGAGVLPASCRQQVLTVLQRSSLCYPPHCFQVGK